MFQHIADAVLFPSAVNLSLAITAHSVKTAMWSVTKRYLLEIIVYLDQMYVYMIMTIYFDLKAFKMSIKQAQLLLKTIVGLAQMPLFFEERISAKDMLLVQVQSLKELFQHIR